MREELVEYLKSVAEERAVVEWDVWWTEHEAEVRQSLPTGWYCRLQQKGVRAVPEVLERLGVTHTSPEPEPYEPERVGEGVCPLCQGEITDQERYLHYRLSDGGGGWWYQGRCRPCDIDFLVQLQAGIPAVWHPDAPDVAYLVERLTPAELQQLNEHPPREVLCREPWQAFVERASAVDEYWTYRLPQSEPDWPLSIARVRRGVPVARFSIMSAEFWKNQDTGGS